MDNEKKHGNHAKIDPIKKMIGAYATNAVTDSYRKENETPVSSDQSVEAARAFNHENQL